MIIGEEKLTPPQLAMIFIIIASAVLTRQMTHLKDQIRHDTKKTITLPSQIIGSQIGDTAEWTTTIQDVSLGSVVLGLTWASVVAMLVEFIMWTWAWMGVNKEKPSMATKEEQYVQG
jgi:hypothetical protein